MSRLRDWWNTDVEDDEAFERWDAASTKVVIFLLGAVAGMLFTWVLYLLVGAS